MSSLLSLGKYIFINFSKEWTVLKEVAFLDSALCENVNRHLFLHYIFLAKSFSWTKPVSANCLKWIQLRNIVISDVLTVVATFFNKSEYFVGKVDHISFSKLKTLTVSGCNSLDLNGLDSFLQCSNGLENIHFHDTNTMNDEILIRISKSCQQVKYISLNTCPLVTVVGISELCRCCHKICVLDLSTKPLEFLAGRSPTNVNDECLDAIAMYLHDTLHTLRLTDQFRPTWKAIKNLTAKCKHLTDLVLNNSQVNASVFNSLAKNNTALTALDMRGCDVLSVKPHTIIAICSRLKVLNFTRCGDHFDIYTMLSGCKLLTEIHLPYGTSSDDLMGKLTKTNSNLCKISFHSDACLTDKFLLSTANNCGSNMLRLEFTGHHNKFSIAAFCVLAERCPNLMQLKMHNLTNEMLICIAEHCVKLTHITLQNNYLLTDVSLVAIGRNCRNMVHFEFVNGGVQMTDVGYVTVMAGCPDLTFLDINGYRTQMTSLTFDTIAENCTNVEHLSLNACTQLNDDVVNTLVLALTNLRHLNIMWCKQCTELSVITVLEKCPFLTEFKQSVLWIDDTNTPFDKYPWVGGLERKTYVFGDY